MSKAYNRWEKFYNKLNTIFHGVIALSMIPFAWAFLETQKQFPEPPYVEGSSGEVVRWSLLIITLTVMAISNNYSKNLLREARKKEGIDNKLKAYLDEKLRDFLLLEVASFLAFAGLYLTKEHIFSFVYVAILLVFSFKRPRYEKVLKELGLKDEEITEWIEAGQK